MESSSSSSFLPPNQNPNPNPNPRILPSYNNNHHTTNITTTLSTLKHLIHLTKSTLTSLSTILPTTTTTTTATCPYNPNHRLPPSSLFHHHLLCPSSLSPISLSLLPSFHSSPNFTFHYTNTHLIISLSHHPNFFYTHSPSVVTFPQHTHNNADVTLPFPSLLSSECHPNHDVTQTIHALSFNLLPSESYNVRIELSHWNDYPLVYSRAVLCLILCCYAYVKEDLMEWMLVNSPFYGVVIDAFIADHMIRLFRVCFKAIVREAVGYLVSVSGSIREREGDGSRFDCPVLNRVLVWLGLQFGILYGEVNGKLFAINMLKHCLISVSSKCLIRFDESSGESEQLNRSKENDGMILVSQVAEAVAALHQRAALETRIKGIRASRFVPAYQRVQEHEYISKVADEERKRRPDYKPIIEHDGVLWQRGGNQDSNKNKSQEELLAEERDYKRRRMSYRGKKMKRSTTQVMRDIIDEYMEEIKHANMAAQPSADDTNLESEPSSTSNIYTDKEKGRHDEIKHKTLWKGSGSDISMRSARYEDEVKEKSNKHRHKDNRSSIRRKDRSSSPNRRHKSKHKDRRSSSILSNEFEDRYDPSKSHDVDV